MNQARRAYIQHMGRMLALASAPPAPVALAAAMGEPEAMVGPGDSVELHIRGEIMDQDLLEMFGMASAVSDIGFARAVAKAKATGKPYRLRINSVGGDVFAGVAIAAMVREHAIPVVVDGVAASIASVITAASPHVTMALGATIMVHSPSTCVCGNARDMRALASELDKIESAMLDIYAAKTGAKYSRDAWLTALQGAAGADGTWLTGTEAVAVGIADVYEKGGDKKRKASALLAERIEAAARNGVTLPKNLSEASADADDESPMAPALGGSEAKPEARVGRLPGISYLIS